METLEIPYLDNQIIELRCSKQDKPSTTASGLGYPDSESVFLALSDDIENQQVHSVHEQIGDRLNLRQQVESAEVPETWEDLVKKEEDEPDELLSDEDMEEQPS